MNTASGAARDAADAGSLGPRQWLQQLGDARRSRDAPFLVGGSGHLLLSTREEERIADTLSDEVLPEVIRLSRGRHLLLVCGLAPGADLVFQRVAAGWLREHRVPHDTVGLLPVPPRQLAEDWAARANLQGYTVSARDRAHLLEEIERAYRHCSRRVHLFDADPAPSLLSHADRQQQYRRLGALLATQSDALVAVLRREDLGQPGGTAEIVTWRREPQNIPAELWPGPSWPTRTAGALFVIHPGIDAASEPRERSASAELAQRSRDEEERVVQAAEEAMAAGNDLLCNDLAFRAHERGLRSARLAYLRLQSLANVGSAPLARRQYDELAPPPETRDARWLTLLGRLEKDLGSRGTGVARTPHLLAAAQAYLAAYAQAADSYPAINAATSLVLAGERGQGRIWAETALRLAQNSSAADEGERYFRAATEAEANLILGDAQGAARSLQAADALLPGDFARRNRTRRQLQRLCEALDIDPAILEALRLPALIFLRRLGPTVPGPADALQIDAITLPAHASIFAGLCDATDLCVLERLLGQGRHLYLTLPFSAIAIIEHTHRTLGHQWGHRLESCLARAQRLSVNRGFLEHELAWSAAQVTQRAFGLSLLAASRSGAAYQIIEVQRENDRARLRSLPALEDSAQRPRIAQQQVERLEQSRPAPQGRRMVGLIFADIAGFMRLDDPELPRFWDVVMRGISQVISRHHEAVLSSQTWGDALHVVTTDGPTAARIATAIQGLIQELVSLPDSPFPALQLRVAAHYAPAFEGHDPIQDRRTYFGTQLTFTARIEPVTPPGRVYITEALAAQLALEVPEEFSCEYVGEIALAKRFGTYRVYATQAA